MPRWIALLMLTVLPAGALVPDPLCALDEQTGTIWPFGDPRGEVPVWQGIFPGEVVTFYWIDADERVHGFVQVCQSDAALGWSIDTAGEGAMRSRLYEMLDSDIVYSLGDVGRMIRGFGGRAARTQSPGTCACDSVGF